MSRLGYAIGEIARGIHDEGLPVDPNESTTEPYVNSGDALTELRNIRRMLTRATIKNEGTGRDNGDWRDDYKIPGLDQGGIVEELESLALLFKGRYGSGSISEPYVYIGIAQGVEDMFPVNTNEFTDLVWSGTVYNLWNDSSTGNETHIGMTIDPSVRYLLIKTSDGVEALLTRDEGDYWSADELNSLVPSETNTYYSLSVYRRDLETGAELTAGIYAIHGSSITVTEGLDLGVLG